MPLLLYSSPLWWPTFSWLLLCVLLSISGCLRPQRNTSSLHLPFQMIGRSVPPRLPYYFQQLWFDFDCSWVYWMQTGTGEPTPTAVPPNPNGVHLSWSWAHREQQHHELWVGGAADLPMEHGGGWGPKLLEAPHWSWRVGRRQHILVVVCCVCLCVVYTFKLDTCLLPYW